MYVQSRHKRRQSPLGTKVRMYNPDLGSRGLSLLLHRCLQYLSSRHVYTPMEGEGVGFIPKRLQSDTSSVRKLKYTILVRKVFSPNSL